MCRLSPTCDKRSRRSKKFDKKEILTKYETNPHQEGELVGVLAGGGHPDGAWPVVIEVGQLVRQHLDVLGLQAGGILDDVVAGGVDGALPHRLGDQEEVVPGREEIYFKEKQIRANLR